MHVYPVSAADGAKRLKLAGGLAGVASPVVFTAFVVTAGTIVPHYDHVSQHISELARQGGQYAWVMRLGLVLVGMLDLVLAAGLQRGIAVRGRIARLGPRLVALLGIHSRRRAVPGGCRS